MCLYAYFLNLLNSTEISHLRETKPAPKRRLSAKYLPLPRILRFKEEFRKSRRKNNTAYPALSWDVSIWVNILQKEKKVTYYLKIIIDKTNFVLIYILLYHLTDSCIGFALILRLSSGSWMSRLRKLPQKVGKYPNSFQRVTRKIDAYSRL